MGTITGLTAERMLEIEAASVVDGDIVGDNLFLTRKDGTPLNAGATLTSATVSWLVLVSASAPSLTTTSNV